MDRRSWLWRRTKSTDKSSAETETSASSASGRFTDEQDTARSSPKSTQSPPELLLSKELEEDVDGGGDVKVKVKVLSERLASAVQDVRAKDELVKQHSKVAEEAVLGWEKAEMEIASLKAQLSAAAATNSALEDRLIHLDGALKECVRQLRRAKEEQERDAAAKQAREEWEAEKAELQLAVVELTARLEAKSERGCSVSDGGGGGDASARVVAAALEKEVAALKAQLRAKAEELEVRTVEKELNRRAAEAASKQQLESIRKVAKLEAECRRLQAAARRPSLNVELRRTPSSVCAESVMTPTTDCSDSWGSSALITELDQFRNDRGNASSRSAAAVDIDGVMDDFLEMEKQLASAPTPLKCEEAQAQDDDATNAQVAKKLEEKCKKLAADREKALHEVRVSRHRALVAEERSAELQRQLNAANGEKHALLAETEAERRELERAHAEVASLRDRGRVLEERVESEKTLTLELAAKYQDMEALGAEKRELTAQLEAARAEAKKLGGRVAMLERKLEVEKALSIRLATKCHGVEALEAKKKDVERELESAREEVASLHKKVGSLELKLQEKTASLATRCKEGDELRLQLESASAQVVELNEKVKQLEETVEKSKALTMELESELETRRAEISSLKENVCLLETKLESQKNMAAAYISALGSSEDEKNMLATQFQLKQKQVEELLQRMSSLEEQRQKEREQLSEFAAKCHKMEEHLSSAPLGHHHQSGRKPVLIKDHSIKKEKELAKAAGKLADCQKTIASLSSKLKSLADFDDFLTGIEGEGASVDVRDDDMKMHHPDNYPAQISCLAVT